MVRQGEQLKYMENLNNEHEKTIGGLEEDIVQLLKVRICWICHQSTSRLKFYSRVPLKNVFPKGEFNIDTFLNFRTE